MNQNIVPLYQFDVGDNSIYAFQSFYDSKTGLYGVTDSSGNIIIPAKYDWVRTNPNATFRVAQKGSVGIIDLNDNAFVPFGKYSSIDEPNEGLMPAKLADRWGYLDLNGGPVVAFAFTHVTAFREGRAFVQKEYEGNYAILDTKCDALTDFIFSCNNTCVFHKGKCLVYYKDSQDIIDLNGKPQFDFRYEQLIFTEPERAFFWAKKKGKWGKVSPYNVVLVPFEYEDVTFRDGKIVALKDGKWENDK